MKKTLTILMVLVVLCSLVFVSCSKKTATTATTTAPAATTTTAAAPASTELVINAEQYKGADYVDPIKGWAKYDALIAAIKAETDTAKMVTVQISQEARRALNVVDHPELVGQRIKVQGLLVNEKGNPKYLGKDGIRNVITDAQYEIDGQSEAIEDVQHDVQCTKVLRNGQLYLMHKGTMYDVQGRMIGNF